MSARRRIARLSRRDDEHGFVVLWMVIVLVLLLSVAAFSVDLVHAYVEGDRAQKAADAAALAGAAEIPVDTNCATAVSRADELADANGFDGTTGNTVQAACTGANQMTVNVTSRIDTYFAKIMGISTLTVKRKAVAEYDAPLAMGSPANNLGDAPSCPPTTPVVTAPNCVSPPSNALQHLWAQIQGPGGIKQAGNAFTSDFCNTTPVDGCLPAGSPLQTEFDPNGEYFFIHNAGGPLDVWLFDAGLTVTGPTCNPLNPPPADWPAAVTGTWTNPAFCTGDQDLIGGGQSTAGSFATTTYYQMLQPDSTPTPTDNPVYVNGSCGFSPVGGLTTIPGHDLIGGFPPSFASVDATTQKTFHQWAKFCTIPTAGDWVLHVTTANPTTQSPDLRGRGSNQFSILALHGADPSDATVFTRARLPILVSNPNSGQATEFYIARVLPSPGRDRTLSLDFFDFGDEVTGGSTSGEIDLKWENVSSATSFINCRWRPPPPAGSGPQSGPPNNGILTDVNPPWLTGSNPAACSWHYDKATWNGRWVTVQIPIPSSYNCDTSKFKNCWLKLLVAPAGGPLADATTWNAAMAGAPVRLVG